MSGHTPWITGGDSDPTAILCSENYNQIAAVNDALDGWNGHAHLIAAAPTQHEEMLRFLPIIERAEADPELWGRLTAGTGIATANGYRAAIKKAAGAQP